ncbi:hypothetical protein HDV01_006008 [Terramyces sp. JEL0728]|nr:hypothetical protein HDV01_006008 [Terramyces sp. JEL0728]
MEYVFRVRQQPVVGREAGLAKPYTKTYLNPIPIFEIVFNSKMQKEQLQTRSFICNLVLVGVDKNVQHILVGSAAAFKRYHENVIGKTTVEGLVLTDPEDGSCKIFFIFNDLYIKTPGEYRFYCQLVDMSELVPSTAELQTDKFTIHKLNHYDKARVHPTLLTRSFEMQGVDIRNKKYIA